MQIIMATDYALRSLLYLARVGRLANAAEIAGEMHVPRQYLVSMARKLKEGGLLEAAAGMNGGYMLALPPEKITVLDIVRLTEGTEKLNRCSAEGDCGAFDGACPLKGVYSDLQNTVNNLLNGITLADLVAQMKAPEAPAPARKTRGGRKKVATPQPAEEATPAPKRATRKAAPKAAPAAAAKSKQKRTTKAPAKAKKG